MEIKNTLYVTHGALSGGIEKIHTQAHDQGDGSQPV
jgi:hypothetical protein